MAFQLEKLGFKTKQSSVCHLITVNLGKWYDPWASVSWAVEKRTPLQDSAEDQWVVCIKPPSHPSSQCMFVVDQLRWSWVPSCPAPMLKEEEWHRASRYERFWLGNGWGVVLARERPAQLYSGRSCQAQSVWFSVFESRKFRQNPGGSKEVLFGWRGPFSAPKSCTRERKNCPGQVWIILDPTASCGTRLRSCRSIWSSTPRPLLCIGFLQTPWTPLRFVWVWGQCRGSGAEEFGSRSGRGKSLY